MKKFTKTFGITLALLSFGTFAAVKAQIITQWNFDKNAAGVTQPVAINPSPTSSTGSGVSSALGMTNTYSSNGASANTDDILVDQGTDTTSGSTNTSAANQAWRVRGTGATNVNGWNSAAPIGTQGAQFTASTLGFNSIKLTFDIDITTQGEGRLQVEYTTDGTNWFNAPLTYAGAGATVLSNSSTTNGIVVGSYLNASLASPSSTSNWFNQITANLSGVSGVNDDAAFAVRIVNAATGSADVALKTSQGQINNTSGNWRFDNVTISGVADVPEPGPCALLVGGLLLLASTICFRRHALNA